MAQAEPIPFVESPSSLAGAPPVAAPTRVETAPPGLRRGLVLAAVALGVAGLVVFELRTFAIEAQVFHLLAREAAYEVAPGAARWELPAPEGPFDRRLGYADLRARANRLGALGFEVVGQARPNPPLLRLVNLGLFPPYREKSHPGLRVLGRGGIPLFEAPHPARLYEHFDEIPPVLVTTLLFIENRELLDEKTPRRNPAVEWDRLALAAFGSASGTRGPGGSTLATQIEKFRHSPEGVTASPVEKLRQMLSASLRAYRDGAVTHEARRRIVVDYLNSVPLAAVPGHGEVFGFGDGLSAWFGASFDDVNQRLSGPLAQLDEAERPAAARAYAQALALLVAQRRPTALLVARPEELGDQMRRYLPLLAQAGVIPGWLRDAALAQDVTPGLASLFPYERSPRSRRHAAPLRGRLAWLLGTRDLYELDRLDLDAETTLDARAQALLSDRVELLREPGAAAEAGLVGFRLLEPGTADGVDFALSVYERGEDAHRLRAQVDNSSGALDLNDGAMLDLGSTAKLRTLVTYLEVVANLHGRFAALPAAERAALELPPSDRLGRWVLDQMRTEPVPALRELVEAALDRRYSASPWARFFTGGGVHRFQNFDASDDARRPTVREALARSVNLVFVRVLDDVVDHIMASELDLDAILAAPAHDPRRQELLRTFALDEGREFLARGYQRLAGLAPEEAVARLYEGRRPTTRAVTAALRSIDPDADEERVARQVAALVPNSTLTPAQQARLYRDVDPRRWTLQDQGYLAKAHPLDLWLLGTLRDKPGASFAEVLQVSDTARLVAYQWLFQTRRRGAQDLRIRTLIEREAFERIHEQWQATGYPFPSLVPSLATALGSSADRPTALAELMGLLVNDGVRVPIRRLESLRFAAGTPYETVVAPAPAAPERVLHAEVAAALREALVSTVDSGTARRAHQALLRADGSPAVVGGKTGTGDHRREQGGGRELPVSRSATFVFSIDERFFGVITAMVTGPRSGEYHFTSSLPVQIFAELMPEVLPLLEQGEDAGPAAPGPAPADEPLLATVAASPAG